MYIALPPVEIGYSKYKVADKLTGKFVLSSPFSYGVRSTTVDSCTKTMSFGISRDIWVGKGYLYLYPDYHDGIDIFVDRQVVN